MYKVGRSDSWVNYFPLCQRKKTRSKLREIMSQVKKRERYVVAQERLLAGKFPKRKADTKAPTHIAENQFTMTALNI